MKKTALKRRTALKSSTACMRKSPLNRGKPLARHQKTAKILNEPYWSVFTDDLSRCFITGLKGDDFFPLDIHHVFGSSNKEVSEKYGYVVPLRRDFHTLSKAAVHENARLDLALKVACEMDYVEKHGTREDFIKEFGKWWGY